MGPRRVSQFFMWQKITQQLINQKQLKLEKNVDFQSFKIFEIFDVHVTNEI